MNVKDKPPKEKRSNIVYGISCANVGCTESYIGETKQALKSRIYQHRRPSYGDNYDSAVYSHLCESDHDFSMENVVILDTEEDWFSRGVRESIHERIERPSLNRHGGLRHNLSATWNRILRNQPRKLRHNPRDSDSCQTQHPTSFDQ